MSELDEFLEKLVLRAIILVILLKEICATATIILLVTRKFRVDCIYMATCISLDTSVYMLD